MLSNSADLIRAKTPVATPQSHTALPRESCLTRPPCSRLAALVGPVGDVPTSLRPTDFTLFSSMMTPIRLLSMRRTFDAGGLRCNNRTHDLGIGPERASHKEDSVFLCSASQECSIRTAGCLTSDVLRPQVFPYFAAEGAKPDKLTCDPPSFAWPDSRRKTAINTAANLTASRRARGNRSVGSCFSRPSERSFAIQRSTRSLAAS